MPKEIVPDHLPAGYAKHGGRPDQEIDVVFREFCSTEDGQHFISRLEETATAILEKISDHAGSAAAVTSSLLAIIRPDRSATVYWNEFHPTVQVRAKGKINKGDLVFLDHIMDVERLILPNGLVPADAGLCYVFSFGWSKGLFFDYGPLLHGNNRRDRDYDLGLTLGYCYARVLFQHIFSISEEVWAEMFSQGWFPFSYLSTNLVRAMIGRAAEKLPIDDQLEEISAEVSKILPSRLDDWKNDPIVSGHVEVLQRAYERFLENDFISAASILYPRIEGVMRTFGATEHPRGRSNTVRACQDCGRHGINTRGKPFTTAQIRGLPARCLFCLVQTWGNGRQRIEAHDFAWCRGADAFRSQGGHSRISNSGADCLHNSSHTEKGLSRPACSLYI